VWGQAGRVSVERALGVDMVAGVAFGCEMIDEGWPVFDARLLARHQAGKVVVLSEMVTSLSKNALQLAPKGPIFDALDLARKNHLAVPDRQRRKLCQIAYPVAIRLDCGRRDRARPLVGEVCCQSSDRDARR